MAWSSRSRRISGTPKQDRFYVRNNEAELIPATETEPIHYGYSYTVMDGETELATFDNWKKAENALALAKIEATKTSKRKKEVFPTDEIPHLWMHKAQSSARNSGGNLYFSGDTIYSYGSHFPIARHVQSAKGKKAAVLLTTRRYSNTTSKHIHAVKMAIPDGVKVFKVYHLDYLDHSGNVKAYQADIDSNFLQAGRARKYGEPHLNQMTALFNEAKEYIKFFGLKDRVKLPASLTDVNAAIELAKQKYKKVRKEETEREKQAEARRKAQQIEADKKLAERIELWKAGKIDGAIYAQVILLRIKDGNLETSRGATIPLSHAKRGLRLVRYAKAMKVAYKRNGHTIHLGHYALDSIDIDGNVKAGCHNISWEEIERIAPELDAIKITVSDETPEAEQ